MNNQTEIFADYSSRRPKGQAWKVSLDGHTTYAETREKAIQLHSDKVKTFGRMNSILNLCATNAQN
ncbi:MAG: hypothetical protein HFE63_08220 [Clostridiales bacterium]|nr:hypothetical protein [Clostridiales bacterium]